MIITTTGKYPIIPMTAINEVGNPYRVREAEITEVDKVNHKIYCPDLDLPVATGKKKRKKGKS
jgi:hypothetical protein